MWECRPEAEQERDRSGVQQSSLHNITQFGKSLFVGMPPSFVPDKLSTSKTEFVTRSERSLSLADTARRLV